MLRALGIAGWNLLAALVLIGLFEFLVVRAEGAPPPPLFDQPDRWVLGRDFIVPHPERGFALSPDFGGAGVRINGHGFRGRELPPARPTAPLLLALGDSTTFGWQVDDTESWPHQLEELLQQAGHADLRVVNAGVPSYSSAQTLLHLRELLYSLRPDVVLVSVLWNDVWYSTLEPWYPDALVRGRPDSLLRCLYESSALVRWRMRGAGGELDPLNPRALDHYRDNLDAMARASSEVGTRLAFLTPTLDLSSIDDSEWPLASPVGQGYLSRDFLLEIGLIYTKVLDEVALRHGVAVIDHRLSIHEPEQPELFLDFIHPGPRGNRMIAEDVNRVLRDRGWL